MTLQILSPHNHLKYYVIHVATTKNIKYVSKFLVHDVISGVKEICIDFKYIT